MTFNTLVGVCTIISAVTGIIMLVLYLIDRVV